MPGVRFSVQAACAAGDSSAGHSPDSAAAIRRSNFISPVIILALSKRTLIERRRLSDAPDRARQPRGQGLSFLIGQEAADLVRAAMRLDREAAGVQARVSAAKFNLRPVPRKLDLLATVAKSRLHGHALIAYRDGLRVMPPSQACRERP